MKKNAKTDANTGSSSQPDNSPNESTSNKMRKSRRRLIQGLVAGGVVVTAKSVPYKWSRPVVEAVMLPAHAQTSGQLITLGNNNNFGATSTQDLERTESLLASGIEQVWGEFFDSLIEKAYGQDTQLACAFTGCSYIEYRQGENSGQLFISVFDNVADDFSGPTDATDLVLNFTNGQVGSFSETCLGPDIDFLVELISDNLAKLTLLLGQKIFQEFDLVNNFVCEPVEDGFIGDDT